MNPFPPLCTVSEPHSVNTCIMTKLSHESRLLELIHRSTDLSCNNWLYDRGICCKRNRYKTNLPQKRYKTPWHTGTFCTFLFYLHWSKSPSLKYLSSRIFHLRDFQIAECISNWFFSYPQSGQTGYVDIDEQVSTIDNQRVVISTIENSGSQGTSHLCCIHHQSLCHVMLA